MPTDKQREAARLNGAKSRGPVTPEGKAKSRMNALHHGLASSIIVLPGESQQHFRDMMDDFVNRYQPVDVCEYALIEEMVVAQWLIRRGFAAERYATLEDGDELRGVTNQRWQHPVPEHIYYLVGAAQSITHGRVGALQRYIVRHQRAFRMTLRTLMEMQANRPPHLGGAANTPAQPQNQELQNEPAEASTPAESTPALAAQTAAEPAATAVPARPALRGPRTFPSGYSTYPINPVFAHEIAGWPPPQASSGRNDTPEIAQKALRMCA